MKTLLTARKKKETAQKKKDPQEIVKACTGKSTLQVIGFHTVIKKSPPVQRLALWQSRCCRPGRQAP